MPLTKEAEDQIQELQLLEQNLQNFAMQKQSFQLQLMEIEAALKELEKVDKGYKIIGTIMVEESKDDLLKDLTSKKEVIELRIKSFEKQETKLREKAAKIQNEVLEKIKSE